VSRPDEARTDPDHTSIPGVPDSLAAGLGSIARTAGRLCEAADVLIRLCDGDLARLVAHHGLLPDSDAIGELVAIDAGWPGGEAIIRGRSVHVRDLSVARARGRYEPVRLRQSRGRARSRSVLATPILRGGRPIGLITIGRRRVKAFTARDIALLESLAEHATTLIDNARLAGEHARLREELDVRTAALTDSLEQQTATAEILRVISGSPTNLQPVLDALVRSAVRFCGAHDAVIHLVDGRTLRVAAHDGPIPYPIGLLVSLDRGTVNGRAVLDRQPVHVIDLPAETEAFPDGSAIARQLGFRTTLAVPLLREGVALGSINLRRVEANPFTDTQTELLGSFADQAVIAIENVRLFRELEIASRHRSASA